MIQNQRQQHGSEQRDARKNGRATQACGELQASLHLLDVTIERVAIAHASSRCVPRYRLARTDSLSTTTSNASINHHHRLETRALA